jgi:hypothetical protein
MPARLHRPCSCASCIPLTGTEKQAVAEDYHRLLHKGWTQAATIVNKALLKLLFPPDTPAPSVSTHAAEHTSTSASTDEEAQAEAVIVTQRRLAAAEAQTGSSTSGAAPAIFLDQCPLLNASICEPTMAASQAHLPFLLVVYNPLAQPRTEFVRVPVIAGPVHFSVEGAWLQCSGVQVGRA